METWFPSLTGITLAAWWAAFVATVIGLRPRIVADAVAVDSGMTEPPAIAALLYPPDGEVPGRAASATFLDLAARGMFRFERDPQGVAKVMVAARLDPGLRSYELVVYDHAVKCLQSTPSLAPEHLLQLEQSETDQALLETFRDQVVADGRSRGLVKDQAPRSVRALLRLALLVPAVTAAAALTDTDSNIAFVLIVFCYAIMSSFVAVLRRPVPTPVGARLAAVYRTLRAQLAATSDPRPPGDRLAAYGLALGAPAADRVIWSITSGTWRQVRISKLPSVPVTPPDTIAMVSVTLLMVPILGALALFFVQALINGTVSIAGTLAGFVYFILMGGAGAISWVSIYRATYDSRHEAQVITGRIVYLKVTRNNDGPDQFYVALDNGRTLQAEVFQIGQDLFERLRYGDWLRLEITPKRREIRTARVVTTP